MTKDTGSYTYLASPYSHPSPLVREIRYLKVCRAAAAMFNSGIPCYSPIVHWHEIAKIFELPLDHEPWLLQDSIMLTSAKDVAVLRLEGWELSRGVQSEMRFAALLDKPIIYIDDGEVNP